MSGEYSDWRRFRADYDPRDHQPDPADIWDDVAALREADRQQWEADKAAQHQLAAQRAERWQELEGAA